MKRIRACFVPILLMVLVLASGGGCSKKARATRILEAADRDFNEEKYDAAEVEYKDALHTAGMNPAAVGQLGRIYAKEGKMLDARVYLTKATDLMPNSLPFQLALGEVYTGFHEFTNATKIALRILSAQPTNEEALLLWMNAGGQPQQLKQQLDAMPRVAENPGYHVALGMLALRQAKAVEAKNEANLALAANPKSSQAYFLLAQIQAYQKNGNEEAQALKKAAELAPPRSPIRSKYIDFLVQNGSVDQARQLLQEMTQQTPDYIPGWTGLMHLAMNERKYDDAGKFADTILERDARHYDALLVRGQVLLAKGDEAKAITQFEHMDTLYKKSAQVKYELAVAYIMAHDKVKGMASLNQALTLDPGYAQAAMLLAQLDIRGGDPATAVTLLNRFIKKAPNFAQAYLLLADAYMAQQKPDSAIAAYRNLGEIVPKSPEIPVLIGVVLASEHRDAEARAAFEKSLQLGPDYLVAVEQLINLDLTEHKYKEASALAQAQMSKAPKSAVPWELQAKIDLAQTNLPHAETALLKAIDLDPDAPTPYLLLAQVYGRANNYKEALQKLNSLVERTNNAAAYLQIGTIHEQLKEFDAARDAYEKVLTVNPKSVAALNNLAYLYSVRLNKLDRAYELAQQARELEPYNVNINDTLGWILYQKGEYSRALTMLQDAVEKAPANAEMLFHLGMAHYMLDEEDSARVALQKAAASAQDFPNKDEARKRLAVLNMDAAKADASALPELEKALKDHPNDPVILNRIGMFEERQGAFEKAADAYETVLKQNPGTIRVMAKLARLYATQLNQPEKALNLATDAHKLAPDNPEVSAVLGHLVFHAGKDYPWALSLLENSTERLPNQPDLLYDLAWAYYGVGRTVDAEATMQKALQTGTAFSGSEDAKRFVTLVDALSAPTKVQAEAGEAQKMLQTDAKYVPALMVAGAAEERAGNYKEAQDAYDKALASLPMFVPAARQAALLDAARFPDDARGCAWGEKARAAYPEDPEVAKSLGILSYYQAKFSRSAELLQESAGKVREGGEAYYYLGMDYYQLKRNKEGKQALERALTLQIPDKLAAEARRTLAGSK